MDPKAPSGPDGRVLRFRPRAQPPVRDQHWSPVEDLHKYTQTRDEDYRHRMLMNLIAVLVALVLVGCGIWLMNAIVQMRTASRARPHPGKQPPSRPNPRLAPCFAEPAAAPQAPPRHCARERTWIYGPARMALSAGS